MNWKDWLYISKSDRIAILCLIGVILILLVILFFLESDKKSSNIQLEEPQEYLQWKAQLIAQKEVEEKQAFEEYTKKVPFVYQPKMRKGETIELNTADTTQLKTIPGIGSGFANRIINYRNNLGGYAKIEQLNEVWGLDTYLYSQIIPYITLTEQHDSLFINTDSFEKLLQHPYLNYKQVSAIVDIRERKGNIKSLKRLQLLDEFSRRDLERLSLYISFSE